MKNKKTILLIVPVILAIGMIIYNFRSRSNPADIDIEKILKSSNYSYLSDAAKEYVRNYYNETGEVLLTEKNKVKDEGYLNPDYIEFLNSDSNSGTGFEPNAITYDYNYDYNINVLEAEDLPSKYDSRDVNGNNYVTPIKRQFNELCWDYAYTSAIESKLLKEGLETDASSLDLSERMMDYATSVPISSIDIGKNPYFGNYALNSLANSGNVFRYSSALVNGLFPINESYWQYEKEYMGKVKPEDIYDLNKINYQVNEVHYIEDNNINVGFDENTNKILKQHIIDNGSVGLSLRIGAGRNYVSYQASEAERLNADKTNNTLYYKAANAKYQSNDHMVTIIGWNDDYVHSVCVSDSGELTNVVDDTCSTGTLKTINGAWIIKDSAAAAYHYVAYETVNSDYFAITDLSHRDWDNVYSSSNSEAYTKSNNTYTFTKKSNVEKVTSIKFYSAKTISNLEVYINTYDETGEVLLTTINTEIGGMYTIPITQEFVLASDKFSIRFSSYSNFSQFSVFTSDFDEQSVINIDDAAVTNSFNYQGLLEDYNNVIVTSGISRNVNDNINFVIKNSDGADVTSLFEIIRNYPVGNYINTLIMFNNNVPIGEYTGYAYVNEELYETFKIDINKYMEKVSGDGTEENPFIITNPAQLDMMRLNAYNHYKLGNDIDLTYDTQNENGLFYNDGLGWEPISYSKCTSNSNQYISCSSGGFNGSFDGDNHKIVGLYINRPDESVVGLFRNTYNNNFSGLNFRNITLKDVNITGNNYVGGLIGYAYGTTHERTLIFENISVTGRVRGNDYVGGIIGYFNGGTGLDNYLVADTLCTKRHCLNNLFNSSKVEGNNYVGGIVGLLASYGNYSDNVKWRSTIDAYNWQNNGTIISDNSAAGLIGYVLNKNGNVITINDSINTGIVKSPLDAAIVTDVECSNASDTYPTCSIVFNNIYYTNDTGYNTNDLISTNNVQKYDILDLTNDDIYNSFTDFSTYYKKETIDGIKRIPFVKNAYVEYVVAEDINIEAGSKVNLSVYINPNVEFKHSGTLDSSIASIDAQNNITALKAGSTTIHITSNYDGYDRDININVFSPKRTITFETNGGSSVASITATVGSDLLEPVSVKQGYIFKGWYLDNGTFENQFIISTMPEEDITVYAKWEIEKYTVTFDANGGTGEMENQTFIYEEAQSLNAVSFSKTGHTFKKWNTNADGSGTSYLDKENIKIYEDCTLYAIWEKEFEYIISEYTYDISQRTIDNVSWNTSVEDYKSRFTLNEGYSMEVDFKVIDDKEVIYTGAKTRIYLNEELDIEFTNIIRGEVNGDGKINYLDYVGVYNHIQKVKNPSLDKKELKNEYLIAADISRDDKINYLDYVKIYNKIKELKASNN